MPNCPTRSPVRWSSPSTSATWTSPIGVYELNAAGKALDLAFWLQRANYNADRRQRHLLTPDQPQRLDVRDTRLLGRKLATAGSRIVVALGVIKPDRQLNLGSGKDRPASRSRCRRAAGDPLARQQLSRSSLAGRPMTRVAILTPDPAEVAYPDLWPKVLARLQRALDGAGIEAVPTPWTAHMDDAAGLRDYASVLPLLVWGYHHDAARWQRACATWEREGVRLANPAKVLAWNTDKRYLRELAERGVAIPPTTFTNALSQNVVERAFADTGTDELIVKPAVSGGAWKTRRLRRGEGGRCDGRHWRCCFSPSFRPLKPRAAPRCCISADA